MATTEQPARRRPSPTSARQRYAFGLVLEAPFELRHMAPASPVGSARRLEVLPTSSAELDDAWRSQGADLVVDRRYPDGRPFMTIQSHEELGYRIWAPGYGRFEVSPDGRRLRCALPARGSRWERLFFAQPLPLAAALQRLGVFHASAVELDGRAVALVAASGVGKTSLAVHLIANGARFVADDVVALERGGAEPLVHPGPGLLNVEPHELREAGLKSGRLVRRTDKIQLAWPTVTEPLPLAAVCYLRRGDGPGQLRIEEIVPPDPQLLLASSFISYLRSAQYLVDHLETCAHVAYATRMYAVWIPPRLGAAQVALALKEALAK